MALNSGIEADLRVEPRIAEFPAEGGGASRHLLVNYGTNRIAVKAKCSDNLLYRVTPVHTILDPGQAERMHILREPGPARVDKLVLLYADASTATCIAGVSRDARAIFASATPEGERLLKRERIALIARGYEPHRKASSSLSLPSTTVQENNTNEIAEVLGAGVDTNADRWKCSEKRRSWAKLFRTTLTGT